MPLDQANIPESQCTRNLKAARAVIASEETWTIGTRDDYHGSYCAIGAIEKTIGVASFTLERHHESRYVNEIMLLSKHGIYSDIAHDPNDIDGMLRRIAGTNNRSGHKRTLKMFDDAIAESMALDATVAFA